jgi:hypothetical protein
MKTSVNILGLHYKTCQIQSRSANHTTITLKSGFSYSNILASLPESTGCSVRLKPYTILLIDLVNALPGNSSVNMVQHATTEEAVFRVRGDVTTAVGGGHVTCFL